LFSSLIKALEQPQRPKILVFGGLAVVVTELRDGRPVALRPCFSTGLPLSNSWIERFKENEPGFSRLAVAHQKISSAAWLSWSQNCVTVDPRLCVPVFQQVCLFGFYL